MPRLSGSIKAFLGNFYYDWGRKACLTLYYDYVFWYYSKYRKEGVTTMPKQRDADGKPLRSSWAQREDKGVLEDKRAEMGLTESTPPQPSATPTVK
jgi:hypothetical protein